MAGPGAQLYDGGAAGNADAAVGGMWAHDAGWGRTTRSEHALGVLASNAHFTWGPDLQIQETLTSKSRNRRTDSPHTGLCVCVVCFASCANQGVSGPRLWAPNDHHVFRLTLSEPDLERANNAHPA